MSNDYVEEVLGESGATYYEKWCEAQHRLDELSDMILDMYKKINTEGE